MLLCSHVVSGAYPVPERKSAFSFSPHSPPVIDVMYTCWGEKLHTRKECQPWLLHELTSRQAHKERT